MPQPAGLLGDTKGRDYADKLRLFNAYAAPELRAIIADLGLRDGMSVLDVGCGTGETVSCLAEAVAPTGQVVGIDLAFAHAARAARACAPAALIVQGDVSHLPFRASSFDVIWSANTINHLREPLPALRGLMVAARPGARVVLAQSSFVPDMVFAWDARLEEQVNQAVRRYYRERYRLDERMLASIRALVGLARAAALRHVSARTVMIERVSPLDAATIEYLSTAIFRDTWGARLEPYLSFADYSALRRLTDPADESFALARPDFHFLQTLTVVTGIV